MLEETQKILTTFRTQNRDAFFDYADDFKAASPISYWDGYNYGDFDEIEEVYKAMYSLFLMLDEPIFIGNYRSVYASVAEPVKAIQELSVGLQIQIRRLGELDKKYSTQLVPVHVTLQQYLKLHAAVDRVLRLPEIKGAKD